MKHEIRSLRRFLDWTEQFRGLLTVFRGVSDMDQMWPVAVRSFARSRGTPLPIIGEKEEDQLRAFKDYERRLFSSFRREAVLLSERQPTDEWQWLALAQHY